MIIKIKRFNTSLPMPEYKSAGAAAFDLYARETTPILPKSATLVPLNIAVELPSGFWAVLCARRSVFKKGLMMANGIGVGDEDYCGDEDEYKAALFNFTDQKVVIEKGERIV